MGGPVVGRVGPVEKAAVNPVLLTEFDHRKGRMYHGSSCVRGSVVAGAVRTRRGWRRAVCSDSGQRNGGRQDARHALRGGRGGLHFTRPQVEAASECEPGPRGRRLPGEVGARRGTRSGQGRTAVVSRANAGARARVRGPKFWLAFHRSETIVRGKKPRAVGGENAGA